jgi:iron(II)-dependent oxidoreductase
MLGPMTETRGGAGDIETTLAALGEARARTLTLVSEIDDAGLQRVHSTLMSPLVWDLGHIAAFEDLWIAHRHGGLPLLRPDLAEVYDAFETPRALRGELEFLDPSGARAYLNEVRARTREVLAARGVADGTVAELVLRHEHQHTETMLQTMELAHLPGPSTAPLSPVVPEAATGLELVEVAAGPCQLGAGAAGFAYDNERPRHTVRLPGFLIGLTPVTNGAYRDFVDGGGYERREWWSDEGWALRQSEGLQRPAGWSSDLTREWRLGELQELHPGRPVVHICWHEAQAFARAHGMRLPTEAEWEKAASWDPRRRRSLPEPWGEEPPVAGVHANVDQLSGGTAPVGSVPAGISPYGCEQVIGDVWEWTASEFCGYPGFRAAPYPEYSEVFFGQGYRVLRGGSWATRSRVATPSFRNWDLPQRRQIFAGVRLAADL